MHDAETETFIQKVVSPHNGVNDELRRSVAISQTVSVLRDAFHSENGNAGESDQHMYFVEEFIYVV